MVTCKDCLHYEICQYHITEETNMTVNECSHKFINKADVVEVVRCKNCEKYNTKDCAKGFGWCEFRDIGVMENHYCSFAKKLVKKNDTKDC